MSDTVTAPGSPTGTVSPANRALLASLDTPAFQGMVGQAAQAFAAQYGALVLVDDRDLWFRSRLGFPESVTPRAGSLWDVALAAEGPFVVEDLLADPRFADDPNTIGGVAVRFFVGCVIHSQDRQPIGIFCLAGPDPGECDLTTRGMMTGMVSYVESELAAIAELDRAAEVQRALLPRWVPALEGYDVAGACLPAKFVGGDFFDWYPIDGGMAFTLADVMGKGVGAGIIAATVRATVRTARDDDAGLAVQRAATALLEDLRGADSFVTLFHARLNAADGKLSFVDAGHGLTVLVDADGSSRRLASDNLPLGTTFEAGDKRLEQHAVIEEGGILVSFSDGVLDLYDGSLASVERVAEIARTAGVAHDVIEEIEGLARREGASDDVTLVVIRRAARTGA